MRKLSGFSEDGVTRMNKAFGSKGRDFALPVHRVYQEECPQQGRRELEQQWAGATRRRRHIVAAGCAGAAPAEEAMLDRAGHPAAGSSPPIIG